MSEALFTDLGQINPVHATPYSVEYILILYSELALRLNTDMVHRLRRLHYSRYFTNISHAFLYGISDVFIQAEH
jgi:hypothetical protein